MQSVKGIGRMAMRQGFQRVRFYSIQRGTTVRPTEKPQKEDVEENLDFPRKIFSGIQPTGSLHLGNYLGAVKNWANLQNKGDNVTYCIVDMHSITMPQDPSVLRENIVKMAATMIACGIDPEKSVLFVQSSVKEHTELSWILNCITTMARLGHLPQYKEKTRAVKDIPLGIFVYPVLQAADIMLYKSTHVPVGEDQIQHIQLAQHLAKTFNSKFGATFPLCHAIVDDNSAARIRSLRDPTKKMSKSDPDPKATINIMDEPEAIVEKIKKAMTDFISDVNFDPNRRSGVSNLIAIHSHVTGTPIETIVDEAKSIDTGKYKLRVADAVVAHLAPIRMNVNKQIENTRDLMHILEAGAKKARHFAQHTMSEVYQKIGIGTQNLLLLPEKKDAKANAKKTAVKIKAAPIAPACPARTEVPIQKPRIEKEQKPQIEVVKEFKKSEIIPMEKKTALKKTVELENAIKPIPETNVTPIAVANIDKNLQQLAPVKPKSDLEENSDVAKKAKDIV